MMFDIKEVIDVNFGAYDPSINDVVIEKIE